MKKEKIKEMLDVSVAEVISKLVSNPKFSDLICNKINMEVDTSTLDQEIENYKIQLRKLKILFYQIWILLIMRISIINEEKQI